MGGKEGGKRRSRSGFMNNKMLESHKIMSHFMKPTFKVLNYQSEYSGLGPNYQE